MGILKNEFEWFFSFDFISNHRVPSNLSGSLKFINKEKKKKKQLFALYISNRYNFFKNYYKLSKNSLYTYSVVSLFPLTVTSPLNHKSCQTLLTHQLKSSGKLEEKISSLPFREPT